MAARNGWGWPLNSRKAHFFVDYRSLCGSWLFFGTMEDDNHKSPDNCKKCMKMRERMDPNVEHTKGPCTGSEGVQEQPQAPRPAPEAQAPILSQQPPMAESAACSS